ncbi:hypothetical protein [Alkalihalobacillus pseudalcaliphilus]|uniref:hypothetical protein n=1 Tax=Alkalihalobacillus pseudalcaliphilus TaxID=79884 RepID=UPI000A4E6F73|nr:hypothetical protein [Alkalihalobacillus pseudalcaliphilus]
MSKKFLYMLAAGAISVSMLAACGGDGEMEDPALNENPELEMDGEEGGDMGGDFE